MSIKENLKRRLLEIPVNSGAYREKNILADFLKANPKHIEILLNELCLQDILKEKIQYICRKCNSTTIMDEELVKEIILEDEDGCFECDECMELINPDVDRTGYVFYDIKNKELLIRW